MEMQEIQQQMQQAFAEYLEVANLKPGQICVIGCSTSEVHGGRIGKDSQPDIAAALYEVIAPMAAEKGIYLAFQCCEHLNRALVVDREVAEKYNLQLTDEAWNLLRQETPKELTNVTTQINGSVRELCTAAANVCRELGYEPVVLTDQLCCQAKEAGSSRSLRPRVTCW